MGRGDSEFQLRWIGAGNGFLVFVTGRVLGLGRTDPLTSLKPSSLSNILSFISFSLSYISSSSSPSLLRSVLLHQSFNSDYTIHKNHIEIRGSSCNDPYDLGDQKEARQHTEGPIAIYEE